MCGRLSTSTTRKIRFIIRGAFRLAVRWNYLSVKAAGLAKSPVPGEDRAGSAVRRRSWGALHAASAGPARRGVPDPM
jgi:hypothetical protein